MELSHVEAQQGLAGQQERRFKVATSSTEVTPLMRSSRQQLPKEQGRGSRSEGLYARGRNKSSLCYSAKAFSTVAAVVLFLVIALQGLVRARRQIDDTAETVYKQAQ